MLACAGNFPASARRSAPSVHPAPRNAGQLYRCNAKGLSTRYNSSVGLLRARDGISEMRFRNRNLARNARFLIVEVGSPDIAGRSLCARTYRADCQERLGFFIEIHDPGVWATPLCNHRGLLDMCLLLLPALRLGQQGKAMMTAGAFCHRSISTRISVCWGGQPSPWQR